MAPPSLWSESKRHLLNPGILLADGDAASLQRLQRITSIAAPLARVSTANDESSAIDQLNANACHVLIIDLGLAGNGGLTMLSNIARQHPKLIRIVHSSRLETFGPDLVHRHAHRVLHKPASAHDLMAAVRWALERTTRPSLESDVQY